MDFLYLLEKLRVPGLNELMLTVTRLGEETAFLVAACRDKALPRGQNGRASVREAELFWLQR